MEGTIGTSAAIDHYRSARELERQGRLSEAVTELCESVRLDPEFPDARFELAKLYRKMGQYEESLEHLDDCLNRLTDDVEVVREAAEIRFLAGLVDKATPLFEALHSLHPEDEEVASLCIAISLVHEGPKKALKKLRRFLEQNPNWVAGYLYLGNIHEIEGRLVEAEEAYQRALDLMPDHRGAQENLQRLREGLPLESSPLSLTYDEIFLAECQRLKNDGYLNRAAELMEFWHERYPDHPLYLEMLVDLYRQQGQIHLALGLLKETPSKNSRLLRLEGFLLLDAGNPDRAVEWLAPLREEFSDDPLFFVNYGEALFGTGRDEEAEEVVREGLDLDPENPSLWFLRAKLRKRQGDSEGCRQALEKTLSIDPSHSGANFALGIEYLREGREQEALKPLRRLVETDPDHLEGWRHLAIALTRSKNYPAAIQPWEEVLRLAPGDSQAEGNLAKLRRIVP